MTASDFSAWLVVMGRGRRLADTKAAESLGVDRRRVSAFRRGETAIPLQTALACSALAFGLPPWRRG